MSNVNSQTLLELYEAGHSEAAAAIFDRYVARLVALARSRLGALMQRRVDPDDVVQSAFRSFFLHAQAHEFRLAQSGDLWRLLASITLHKLYSQVETHSAAKRSVHREVTAAFEMSLAEPPEPSAAETVGLIEELSLAVATLSDDERQVLMATLRVQSTEEISHALSKSDRTVRRLLADARRKIEARLLSGRSVRRSNQAVAQPHAPLKFSDFMLERLVGAGGMGKVFRARGKSTNDVVAIKALHKSRQFDERATAQFVQEAQILARLRHPHIVRVHGLGRFPAGGYFLAMDFVDGVDLQRRLERGPLSADATKNVVGQVAAAVQYAHGQGVVHCDLKPANILLDQDDHALVTDFGFAHLLAGRAQVGSASLGGTAGYVAPEVLIGRRQPTPAADIYALGRILWALVAGAASFDPNDLMPPDDLLGKVHAICRQCLADDPSHRPRSADDLLQQVQAI